MVRPNRVKVFKFPAGSLVASAGGVIDVYSHYPVNGVLQGVHVGDNTFASATGSFLLNASGPELTMWSIVSGPTRGTGVGTSGVTYPKATTVYTWASPISGASQDTVLTDIPMNSVLHLVGAGLGTGTSGLEFNVIYI